MPRLATCLGYLRINSPARLVGRFRLLLQSALLIFGLALAAAAQQTEPGFDQAVWTQTVERVQRVLDADRADENALRRLRSELTMWREQFLAAQTANAARAETLRRQIEALGPAPDTDAGESEPEEIAERRAELNALLDKIRIPAVWASTAYAQADGLIREIDLSLRERQARKLLRRFPTPVNLLNWAPILDDLEKQLTKIATEIRETILDPSEMRRVVFRLPISVVLFVIAYLLIRRSNRITDRLEDRIVQISSPTERTLAAGGLLALQLFLPWLGFVCLFGGVGVTQLTDSFGNAFLSAAAWSSIVLVVGALLVNRVFPRASVGPSPLPITNDQRDGARWVAHALVAAMGLEVLITVFLDDLGAGNTTLAYISFVLSVPPAVLLFRLGQVLARRQAVPEEGEETANLFAHKALIWIGRTSQILAVTGVVVGLAGFLNLADGTIAPTILTLALFALILLIQRMTVRVHALLARKDDHEVATSALMPTLIGGFLGLLSVPVLALVWGAQWTDLTEIWTRIREGMMVGDTRLSPGILGILVLVFLVGWALTRLVQAVLRSTVLPKTKLDQGAQSAAVAGIGYVGIVLAAILAVTTAGLNLSSLAIVAGALSVGIGFGLQTIVSNFVSGIILLVERPVSEGDWIEVGGTMGHVRDISVRATKIETFDRTQVIVPNSDLISNSVINWTRGNRFGRVIVPVGVAYGSDTRKVERILKEIAEAHPMVTISPPPDIIFVAFGADSLNFEIRAILRDVNFLLGAHSDMNHEIARRFAEEGIEIPFAQRDIWLRNPESLHPTQRPVADRRHGDGAAPPTPAVPPDPEPSYADGGSGDD